MLQSRPAAGCGDDQINFESASEPANLFVGPAGFRVEAHSSHRQGLILGHLLQTRSDSLPDLRFRNDERRNHRRRCRVFGSINMDEMQFGLKPIEPRNCGDERRIRGGRKISRHEQTPNAQWLRSLTFGSSARRGARWRAR